MYATEFRIASIILDKKETDKDSLGVPIGKKPLTRTVSITGIDAYVIPGIHNADPSEYKDFSRDEDEAFKKHLDTYQVIFGCAGVATLTFNPKGVYEDVGKPVSKLREDPRYKPPRPAKVEILLQTTTVNILCASL